MIRSEARAHVAANEPASTNGADVPGGQAMEDAADLLPKADRTPEAPARPRPPWLVRHSKRATIALVLAIIAASPFAYRYLQRNFGADPLAGIKSDSVRFDANSGTMEIVKSTEVKSVKSDDQGR